MTIKQAYDLFFQNGQTYWAANTKIYYEKNLAFFFRYLEQLYGRPVDQIDLSELPKDILKDYVISLRYKSRYSDHPLSSAMKVQGVIKSNTVRTYLRAVKAFFNFLYDYGYTCSRFTKGVKVPKSDSDQIVPLLQSEVTVIDRIFDPDNPNDLRNLCIIHLMLDAGLRTCEVISLHVSDIIFASSTIVINRSKGDKSRVVIMAPHLAQLLLEYVDIFHPTSCLFMKARTKDCIDQSVINSLFVRIRRSTTVSRIHPHLLRHTFATSYIMGGGNLESLRILMGHSDYTVTRTYLHLASQYQIMQLPIYQLDPIFFRKGY